MILLIVWKQNSSNWKLVDTEEQNKHSDTFPE